MLAALGAQLKMQMRASLTLKGQAAHVGDLHLKYIYIICWDAASISFARTHIHNEQRHAAARAGGLKDLAEPPTPTRAV